MLGQSAISQHNRHAYFCNEIYRLISYVFQMEPDSEPCRYISRLKKHVDPYGNNLLQAPTSTFIFDINLYKQCPESATKYMINIKIFCSILNTFNLTDEPVSDFRQGGSGGAGQGLRINCLIFNCMQIYLYINYMQITSPTVACLINTQKCHAQINLP